jgi:hypothetical protein
MMRAAFMTINPLSSLIAAAMLLQMASEPSTHLIFLDVQ